MYIPVRITSVSVGEEKDNERGVIRRGNEACETVESEKETEGLSDR